MRGLADRVAVVTGAASGLGRACALRLAEEGSKIVVADLSLEACTAVADEIGSTGGQAAPCAVDVTDVAGIEAMVALAVDTFGGLDLAINAAGISMPSTTVDETTSESWDRTLAVNATGVFDCLRLEARQMLAQGRQGAIVNIASYAGLRVQIPGVSPYAAAKHAVVGLTKAAARDLAPRGIRVNAVCPGHIRTPMMTGFFGANPDAEAAIAARNPMGRISEPEEIAGVAVFLLSDDASFVTGEMVVADGGLTI